VWVRGSNREKHGKIYFIMAKHTILMKLEKILGERISNEYQAVYILSRIRKYLEIQDREGDAHEYKYLKFYCNWALHTQIDHAKSIAEFLRHAARIGPDCDKRFINFIPLKEDLLRFLKDNDLPHKFIENEDEWKTFVRLLQDIYAETPLYVCIDGECIEVVLQSIHENPKTGGRMCGWSMCPTRIGRWIKSE